MKFLSDSDSLYDTTPLVDMGVDSLVAVEVRSWFLKELTVDVPVMKILGGASIVDLVEVVVQKLPQELLSRLDPEGHQCKSGNDDAPATPLNKESTNEVAPDSKEPISACGVVVSDANGVNSTHETHLGGNTNDLETNSALIIEDKLDHKDINGTVSITIKTQEVV